MKKNMIIGLAMALGVLSVGAVSASAAGPCCNENKCADKQAVQQFTQEAGGLTGALKAKDIELRGLYSYDGLETQKIAGLEAEIKNLKGKIRVIADKYGISPCCLG